MAVVTETAFQQRLLGIQSFNREVQKYWTTYSRRITSFKPEIPSYLLSIDIALDTQQNSLSLRTTDFSNILSIGFSIGSENSVLPTEMSYWVYDPEKYEEAGDTIEHYLCAQYEVDKNHSQFVRLKTVSDPVVKGNNRGEIHGEITRTLGWDLANKIRNKGPLAEVKKGIESRPLIDALGLLMAYSGPTITAHDIHADPLFPLSR